MSCTKVLLASSKSSVLSFLCVLIDYILSRIDWFSDFTRVDIPENGMLRFLKKRFYSESARATSSCYFYMIMLTLCSDVLYVLSIFVNRSLAPKFKLLESGLLKLLGPRVLGLMFGVFSQFFRESIA
jgi:hypothetical protein